MCPDRATGQGGGPDAHEMVLKTRRLHREMKLTANKPRLQWKASRSELKRWLSIFCDNLFWGIVDDRRSSNFMLSATGTK